MTKQQEIEKIETHLMIFAQNLGEYGGTLNIEEATSSEVKTASMTMQRILKDCYNELENQLNLLK
jgi:ABC-type molybdate transport system permease subunit|tara:strand:+ start:46 stop:240 length:195 start_codon:yes stop_codon:yes gene_type:complete